jgi:hypothetical protein
MFSFAVQLVLTRLWQAVVTAQLHSFVRFGEISEMVNTAQPFLRVEPTLL